MSKNLTPTNNLKFNFPEIAKEWHPIKNGNLKPENVFRGSQKKYWWICPKNKDHEYTRTAYHRAVGDQGCPYCSGKLASKDNNLKILYPDLIKQWHPNKNGNLKPETITKGSHKIIWWLCSKGHEWKTAAKTRSLFGNNCPFCAGQMVGEDNNLKFLFPDIAREWHPTKNGNLKPENVTKGSSQKVWWICSKGHEYQTYISHRTGKRKSNCPNCSNQTSKPEFRILSELETIFTKVDSRHKFKKNEIDIFIKDINVGIEYDGWYFHKNKNIIDKKKNLFFKKNTIHLIRVRRTPLIKLNSHDVLVEHDELKKKDLDNILKSIYIFCNKEQKELIKSYLKHKNFVNEVSFKKYLSYFPGPVPLKSLVIINSELAKQWNYEKNYPLEPESFYPNSNQKVWWICEKKHEWQSTINNRFRRFKLNKINCPSCSGHYTTRSDKDNNLQVRHPIIAQQWHPTKNEDLKPYDMKISSKRKVWWLCPSGHEWITSISSRIYHKSNCPYCYGRYASKDNNFKIKSSMIAQQWHPTKNGNLKPENFANMSSKKVWWLCPKGHEWIASISNRVGHKNNCPYCSNKKISSTNNLKFLFPDIAREWHPTKNGNLKPEDFPRGSDKKVWWLCFRGHEWSAAINSRTSGHNCKQCYHIKRRK